MILQHIYAPILNIIYEKITCRIGDRARDVVIFLSFFLMYMLMFLTMYKHILSVKEKDLAVVLLMGIVILASVDRRLEPIKWRKTIYIPLVITGLWMLIIALFFHSIGESFTIFILFILFVSICLAFVWGNRGDYDRLFKLVSASYIAFYLIILAWCLARYGLYFGESYSMWMNTNGFVKLICPAVACGMHLFIVCERPKLRLFFGAVSGAAGSMIIFTTCKTAQLVLILLFIGFVILLFARYSGTGEKSKGIWKSVLCFLLVFAIGCGVTAGFLHCVTPVITGDPVKTHVNEFKTSHEVNTEPVDENSPYEIYKRQTQEQIESHPVLNRLDQIGTGRIHMWAMYLKRINLTGNVKTLGTAGPHNQYVDLTYRAGLPAGALWLFTLFAVFVMIIYGIVKRKNEWIAFVTLSYPAFLCFSMLETGMFPMERPFILMYYLALTPLLVKKQKGN